MTPGLLRRPTLKAALLSAGLAVGGLAPVAAQDWYEHYSAAEEALKAQDWETAIQQLNRAIGKRAKPGIRVGFEGLRSVDYHPYLKLGIAYYNMGQYDAALGAFDTEVGWGVITKAQWKQQRPDMRNLERFRQLALDAKAEAERSEKERIATIVADSLKEAALLEKQGRWAEGLQVVGKALSVKPDHAGAQEMMARLREHMEQAERLRELRIEVDGLVDRGKQLYAEDRFRDAASVFQQAHALESSDEIAGLLEAAQEALRAKIQAEQDAAQRRRFVRTSLEEAARLEEEGDLAAALDRLQSVLALEPSHAEARRRQTGLLDEQARRQREQRRRAQVARLVEAGLSHMASNRYDEAVAALNRVIGMDPGNAEAQRSLSRAYDSLSRLILESGAPIAPMVPPSIVLANTVTEFAGGAALSGNPALSGEPEEEVAIGEERVSSPDFALKGVIIDDDPEIRVSYLPEAGAPGEGEFAPAVLAGERFGDRLYRFNFSQPLRLRPGVATWRVVATDVDQLTAEVVHQVHYVRPWIRSPWPYAGAVMLIGVVLASQRGARIYRARQLRRRRFNPYIAGAPVLDDGMFFGRERLLSRVLQTVHNNSILLYGERRIGKTSFQHRLKGRLEGMDDPIYDFFPVFIDLQGTPQEQFFYTLAEAIYDGLGPRLGDLPERSRFAEGLPYDYSSFARDLRQVLKALKAQTGKKVKLVLLIDEVDALNEYDPRVNQKLRSLFMKSFAEGLAAVVSGVAIKKHWSSEGSPWYNFFEEVPVTPFRRKDAEELIERPLQGVFHLDKGVVDRIIEITDCKPYSIQRVCVELVDRLHAQKRARIKMDDVEVVAATVEL